MNSREQFFDALWQDYITRLCPSAEKIHHLLGQGQSIVNDHIALRTFSLPSLDLPRLATPFIELGYEVKGEYHFKAKKLFAHHYEHPDKDAPKVFISELLVEQCSEDLQRLIRQWVEQIEVKDAQDDAFLYQGRPWQLTLEEYHAAAQESEYAAWVAAHGYGANHFTVNVNQLAQFTELVEVNQALKNAGFVINDVGGEVKGSASVFLEQSATVADKVLVNFSDAQADIRGGFYEFAKRYPLPDGSLYQGFVEASADKIFESTNQ